VPIKSLFNLSKRNVQSEGSYQTFNFFFCFLSVKFLSLFFSINNKNEETSMHACILFILSFVCCFFFFSNKLISNGYNNNNVLMLGRNLKVNEEEVVCWIIFILFSKKSDIYIFSLFRDKIRIMRIDLLASYSGVFVDLINYL
jgi:ABC-type Mn2+/Zn2+ transport system permease subunit